MIWRSADPEHGPFGHRPDLLYRPGQIGAEYLTGGAGDLPGGGIRADRQAGLLEAVEQFQPGADRQLVGLGPAAGATAQKPTSARQARPEQGGHRQYAGEHRHRNDPGRQGVGFW